MRKRRIISIIIVLAVGAIFVAGREGGRQGAVEGGGAGKLMVSASSYPVYYLVRSIAGDKADVNNLTPPGAEPHDYELSVRDMARIHESGLLVIVGGGLENWGEEAKKSIDPGKTRVVVAGEGFFSLDGNGESALSDPHLWLSPGLMAEMARRVEIGLVAADGKNAAYYEENLKRLEEALEALDGEYREGTRDCARHDFITSHAAFGYLAREYGLTQVSIAGLTPDAEPSARKLAELADFIRANDVRYVFFEELASPKLAQTLAAETGAGTLVLDPLEGLTDEEAGAGEDYMSVMRRNLSQLRTALACK